MMLRALLRRTMVLLVLLFACVAPDAVFGDAFFTDVTYAVTPRAFELPAPKTWSWFKMEVPSTASQLLIEIDNPPTLDMTMYNPVLVVAPITNYAGLGAAAIKPSFLAPAPQPHTTAALNGLPLPALLANVSQVNVGLHNPAQLVLPVGVYQRHKDFRYLLTTIGDLPSNSSGPVSFIIGVFTNTSQSWHGARMFTIRARWVDPLQNGTEALCPLDCSGHGVCEPASFFSRFSCSCSAGYAGPLCEGRQAVSQPVDPASQLSDYFSGRAGIGEWIFYVGAASMSDVLFTCYTSWSAAHMPCNMLMYMVPWGGPPGSNAGEAFFQADAWHRFFPISDQAPRVLATTEGWTGNNNAWLIAVYNGGGEATLFDVCIYASLSPHYRSGSTPVLLVLVLCCCVGILYIRYALRSPGARLLAAQARQQAAGTELASRTSSRRRRGVPSDIIAAFPVFIYHADKAKCSTDVDFSSSKGTAAMEGRAGSSSSSSKHAAAGEPLSSAMQLQSTVASFASFLSRRGSRTAHLDREAEEPAGEVDEEMGQLTPKNEKCDMYEGPLCSVCLCEYEEGEELRQLSCKHAFHKACIDQWMRKHTTCPICRTNLLPTTSASASTSSTDATTASEDGSPGDATPNTNRSTDTLLRRSVQDDVRIVMWNGSSMEEAQGPAEASRLLERRALQPQAASSSEPAGVSHDAAAAAAAAAASEGPSTAAGVDAVVIQQGEGGPAAAPAAAAAAVAEERHQGEDDAPDLDSGVHDPGPATEQQPLLGNAARS